MFACHKSGDEFSHVRGIFMLLIAIQAVHSGILPEKILHFTFTEILQIAISESLTKTYQQLRSKVKVRRAKILGQRVTP